MRMTISEIALVAIMTVQLVSLCFPQNISCISCSWLMQLPDIWQFEWCVRKLRTKGTGSVDHLVLIPQKVKISVSQSGSGLSNYLEMAPKLSTSFPENERVHFGSDEVNVVTTPSWKNPFPFALCDVVEHDNFAVSGLRSSIISKPAKQLLLT